MWTELSDTATDLGYVWSRARTPRQVASWLGGPGGRASDPLRTLTAAVERARYAPTRGRQDEADLERSLDSVQAQLRSRRTTGQRLRATFWPASLGWSRVRWIGRWLPGADRLTAVSRVGRHTTWLAVRTAPPGSRAARW